jgi:hypothetical protein
MRKVAYEQQIACLHRSIKRGGDKAKIFKQKRKINELREELVHLKMEPSPIHCLKKKKINNLEEALVPYKTFINSWISDNAIGNPTRQSDLVWDIISCILDSDIGLDDFKEIIEICNNNDIIIEEGNIWEKLNEHFVDNHITFLKCISNKCPRSLSTSPNADCGKFELFYRLIRPGSRQPNRGDISDNGGIIEIKGQQIRLFADISGKDYIRDTNKIFEGSGLIAKSPTTGGLKGAPQYEIEKTQYRNHYGEQFCINIPSSKLLIRRYFDTHNIEYSDNDIEEMFEGGIWNQSILQNLWLKKMYSLTMSNNGADKIIIFGDGINVKILDSVASLAKFKIDTDYFRINQNSTVGYYII